MAAWLLACAAFVYSILIVGGITRLTHSGLSIVEWKPLMGALPPLSDQAWDSLFDRYRATPEFKLVNFDLTLEGFKRIFWWEYAHRLMGRLVGMVFLLPLLWFALTRRISRPMAWRLSLIFALGGLQGALGWYMVASGLVRDPTVSPFRLTAHLALALLIVGAMLWTAFGLQSGSIGRRDVPLAARAVVVLVFLMAMTGGMVAGTHAGLSYNTFPLMGDSIVPPDLLRLDPWYLNFAYNLATVQFVHRTVAWTLIAGVPLYWWWIRASGFGKVARRRSDVMLAALALQVGLGIATLLSVVWLPLAAAHQAGAVLLYASALWTADALGTEARREPARSAATPAAAVAGR